MGSVQFAFAKGNPNPNPNPNPNFASPSRLQSTPIQALTVGDGITCTCGGTYNVGDRVKMIDPTGYHNSELINAVGVVVKGSNEFSGSPHILVSWDDFEHGHYGTSLEACPHNNPLPKTSGWWVWCNMIVKLSSGPSPSPGLSGCVKHNGGNPGAYEAVLRQPGVLTIAMPLDSNHCYKFESPVAGKSYEISVSGSL